MQHFSGRDAAYATVEASPASGAPGAIDVLGRALGLPDGVQAGDTARVTLPQLVPLDVVIDYRTPHFLGIRTGDALIRCFGRGQWGALLGIDLHLFAPDTDTARTEQAWRAWLAGVFA